MSLFFSLFYFYIRKQEDLLNFVLLNILHFIKQKLGPISSIYDMVLSTRMSSLLLRIDRRSWSVLRDTLLHDPSYKNAVRIH